MSRPFCSSPNRNYLRALGVLCELRSSTVVTLDDLQLPDCRIRWPVWEREICASNAGLYIVEGTITDRLARLARRHPMMTVGLTTALWLNKVLPERPAVDHWMINHAKLRPIWLPPDTHVHLSRHALDDTVVVSLDRRLVTVSQPIRALLDCLRFRKVLGHEVVLAALKALLERSRVELMVLRAHARLEKLEKPLLRLLAELGLDLCAAASAHRQATR